MNQLRKPGILWLFKGKALDLLPDRPLLPPAVVMFLAGTSLYQPGC